MPVARKRNTGALGQVAEWEVWVELVVQSKGWLHVFLPLLDRGIDALVHRLTDGAWVPVQVKSAAREKAGAITLNIEGRALVDDDALIVASIVTDDRLGSHVLVIPERDFKRLAIRSTQHDGHRRVRHTFEASIAIDADRRTRWSPFVMPRDRFASVLMRKDLRLAARPKAPPARQHPDTRIVGFRGEMEVVRRLSDIDDLCIYRPFPDLETAEVVACHVATRKVVALQVKTVSVDSSKRFNTIHVAVDSFRPAPDTWIVVLAWRRDAHAFHDEFLFIPSRDVPRIGNRHGHQWTFQYEPGDAKYRVARYAHRLYALGSLIESLVS
jgi:hypothetical protein